MTSTIERPEVAIVGGGLVGSLLSIVLRKRGFDVVVFERRTDLRGREAEAGRSINLVLTRRGIRALERLGLDRRALELTVPVLGRTMHDPRGELTYQPYGRDPSECNYSISRAGLNRFLVQEAEDRGVRFVFDQRLLELDAPRRTLTFADTAGARTELSPGVVFGADGAGSAVRAGLIEAGLCRESVEMLEHGYKELRIPPAEGGGFRISESSLHIWPRGNSMLMALPNVDGSFTVTLYMPLAGAGGFDGLVDASDVERLFRDQFDDARALIPQLTDEFAENPTGTLGTVRCAPWRVDDWLALIGDSAHAIVPFFGQGMNCGFEDCRVLADILDERPGSTRDWGEILREYDGRRKPNADAIAAMALDNFVEMRDRVGDAGFLLRKAIEHRLEREIPERYRSRYSMVMYSHIPFKDCLDAGAIHEEILAELGRDIASADELELTHAERLIAEKLSPFLEQRGISPAY